MCEMEILRLIPHRGLITLAKMTTKMCVDGINIGYMNRYTIGLNNKIKR